MGDLVTRRLGVRWLIPLLLFILFAFGLRLHNLDSFSFWTDEGLTPLRASYSVGDIFSNVIFIQEWPSKDTHPPFFYFIIHFSRQLWGETDFAYRYPSLLAGVLLVPLMFQFGRRFQGSRLGIWAAFSTAVNPLQIWYGNEARMYTILVLLAGLASYVLWRALTGNAWRRNLILYLLLAGLTIYTHYTAVFLVGIQLLFLGWLLWQNRQRKLLVGIVAVLTLVSIPLIPFTIPRLFTGAEANYYYVSPFIMLQDVIHAFSLGVTIDFKLLSTKLLDLGALGLLLTGIWAARTNLKRAYLLVYLTAVVFGLMAGSLIKPMYQGVRHIMVGSPAFILLLAWGINWLVEKARAARQRKTAVFWTSLAVLGVVTALMGPFLSLKNLYNDPHYAKNNFRSLIQYIERRAGENDLILYNDAVLLPLHDHYQQRPDVVVSALPIYPYPFSAETEATLNTLSQTYDRIWFVTNPPADDRDEQNQVRGWLGDHVTEVDDRTFASNTVEVRVIAYTTTPQTINVLPINSYPLNLQWPDSPLLTGVELQVAQPVTLPTIWLNLLWQSRGMPDPALELRFTLRGPEDDEWLTQSRPLTKSPDNWPDKGLIRQSYALPIPFGTPPGTYTLFLEPLATPTGPPLGEAQPITEIVLAGADSWPASAEQRPSATSSLSFQNGLTLLGIAFPDGEVRPGHNIPITLYWQADTLLLAEGIGYEIEVISPGGSVMKRQEGTPGASWLDTWPAETPIVEYTGLYFRPEAEPGQYRLRWRLQDGNGEVGGRPFWRPWHSEYNNLGGVEVKPWPLVTTLPDIANTRQADFGSAIQLYGYELNQSSEDLIVTLHWQAKTEPQTSYFSFVHLVAGDGTIVAQQAFVPVSGLRPTKGWRPNELLVDPYTLTLPSDLPSGAYTLVAGLFDPDTGERPSVIYQGQSQANNQLVLTTITLP